jgi:hypothetical protein
MLGQPSEASQGFGHDLVPPQAVGTPDAHEVDLRIVRARRCVASHRGQRTLVVSTNCEQARQLEPRRREARADPQGLPVLGDRPRKVAHLLRGLGSEEAARGIVGPERVARLECRECPLRIAFCQQNAAPDQIRHRGLLERRKHAPSLVVLASLHEGVRVGEAEHRGRIGIRFDGVLEGLHRQLELLALHVQVCDEEPGPAGRVQLGLLAEQPRLGLEIAERPLALGQRDPEHPRLGRLELLLEDLRSALGSPQPVVEADGLAHHQPVFGKLAQTALVLQLGRLGLSLLEAEQPLRDAEPRCHVRGNRLLRLLHGDARPGDGGLHLVDAPQCDQGRDPRDQHREVLGVEFQDPIGIRHALFELARGEQRPGTQHQGTHVLGLALEEGVDDGERVGGRPTLQHGAGQQKPCLHGVFR